MNEIYRVIIHGKVLESRNLRRLLCRAVDEKRNMDTRCRVLLRDRSSWESGLLGLPAGDHAGGRQGSL